MEDTRKNTSLSSVSCAMGRTSCTRFVIAKHEENLPVLVKAHEGERDDTQLGLL